MKKDKCYCREILYNDFGYKHDRIIYHLSGCPENPETKKYNKLPWYKKILKTNPKSFYEEHLKLLTE